MLFSVINKECEYCADFVAKSQEEFDFHVLKYHSQPQTSATAKNAINDLIMETVEELDEELDLEAEQALIECDLCEEVFASNEDMEDHLVNHHK